MADYAISTNLLSFVPALTKNPIFGWPKNGPEAEVVAKLEPGDLLVPKFAQTPSYQRTGSQVEYQEQVCAHLGLDFEQQVKRYNDTIAQGQNAVPFVYRVLRQLPDDDGFPTAPWARVAIEVDSLEYPLSTQEFLRLRVVDAELARQFKATASYGRHVQAMRDGSAEAILRYGQDRDRAEALRNLSLVWAESADDAVAKLTAEGRPPVYGDYCFLAADERMLGLHEATRRGELIASGEVINRSPVDLLPLFEEAKARKPESGPYSAFAPWNAIEAAKELRQLIDDPDNVLEIDDFARFHDRYVILSRKVNQALALLKLPMPSPEDEDEKGEDEAEGEPEEGGEGAEIEATERAALEGLDVASVETKVSKLELPPGVLAEAVTALRSGKHLLLSGPPGTGKSTLASGLCRAVVDEEFDLVTATADWTTFDTIGGYLPAENGKLSFEPGLVLRALKRGRWLIIDELNRADIDKAFGPLFSLLAGTGESRVDPVVLPFQRDGSPITIDWAIERWRASGDYTLTPTWRLLGTLNVSDKASLFQLSFAFLRRFAIVDVPLPPEPAYRSWFSERCAEIDGDARADIVNGGMALAFGPRELGPAILKDLARFVSVGMTETSSGASAYNDAVGAFLTAVRLYAVPQYEGAPRAVIEEALGHLRAVWPDPPEAPWKALSDAFVSVALR